MPIALVSVATLSRTEAPDLVVVLGAAPRAGLICHTRKGYNASVMRHIDAMQCVRMRVRSGRHRFAAGITVTASGWRFSEGGAPVVPWAQIGDIRRKSRARFF